MGLGAKACWAKARNFCIASTGETPTRAAWEEGDKGCKALTKKPAKRCGLGMAANAWAPPGGLGLGF